MPCRGRTQQFSLIVAAWLAVHKEDRRTSGSKDGVLDLALRRLCHGAASLEPPPANAQPSPVAEYSEPAKAEEREEESKKGSSALEQRHGSSGSIPSTASQSSTRCRTRSSLKSNQRSRS